MLRYNIQDMSDLELSELSQAIIAERDKRNRVKKEQAWNAVRSAITDYCKQFGNIAIRSHEDYECQADIDIHSNLEDFGCIEV